MVSPTDPAPQDVSPRRRPARHRSLGRALLPTLAALPLVGSPSAWAQDPEVPEGTGDTEAGYPIDLEMIRPGLSPRGGFAVDAPQAGGKGIWSVGALLQYEYSPLRLYDGPELLGSLVAHRNVLQIHAGVGVSRRTSVSVMVPVGVHFGAGAVERSRNGAGLGDAALSLRVHPGTWGPFSLGVLGTVLLPTGNPNQYMGERLPRLRAGLLGHTDLGRVSILTNLLAHVRQPVDTGFDLVAGSELQLDAGVIGAVLPEQLDVIGEVVSRVGLAPGQRGARLAAEAVAGIRYHTGDGFRIDAAVGRGLTAGYGTTGVRVMAGFSYVRPAPPPPPEPVAPPPEAPPMLELVDDLPEEPDPPPPPPPPPEPAIAELVRERIEIRKPIAFEVGTTLLKAESEPVLDAVAQVMHDLPRIGHVVIEGHASQEGTYQANYTLSLDRARAVFEALVQRGVHPKRLSTRGAGEVEPVTGEADEAGRAQDRRVEFHVIHQYAEGETIPDLGDRIRLPWSGTPQRVVVPAVPPEGEAADRTEDAQQIIGLDVQRLTPPDAGVGEDDDASEGEAAPGPSATPPADDPAPDSPDDDPWSDDAGEAFEFAAPDDGRSAPGPADAPPADDPASPGDDAPTDDAASSDDDAPTEDPGAADDTPATDPAPPADDDTPATDPAPPADDDAPATDPTDDDTPPTDPAPSDGDAPADEAPERFFPPSDPGLTAPTPPRPTPAEAP